MARKWRLEPKDKRGADGLVSWRLRTGRAGDRETVALGRVPDEDAKRALTTLQGQEDAGTVGRILALYRQDQAAAVGVLLDDPVVVARLPEPAPDYAAMPLKDYFAAGYSDWRAKKRPASWRTEAGFWARINRPRPEGLGDVPLADIDSRLVADYLDELTIERERRQEGVGEGEPVSGATKRLHRAAIQACLSRAFRLRHLEALPKLAEIPIEGSTKRARVQQDPLTLDEVRRLLDAAALPVHRVLFAVAVGQGLRPSELVRVRWEDIDFEARTLAVRGTKTEAAEAVIPLTPLARAELRRWWLAQGQPAEGVAFPAPLDRWGRMGTEPYSGAEGYKGALDRARQAAGIRRKVSPYLLRHSFATLAWELDVPLDVARRVTRHTSDKMLIKVYQRPRPADVARKLEAFGLGEEEA